MAAKSTKRARSASAAKRSMTIRLKATRRMAAPRGEDVIVASALRAPKTSPRRFLQFQDLLYNTTPELQSLAFKSGFNLGVEAYGNSDGGIRSLERLLENAGFGKIVYYMFESKSTFSSRSIGAHGINTGVNMHVFESGVISGFLSAHARKTVIANEHECVFNGAPHCRFIASAGQQRARLPTIGLGVSVHALAEAIARHEKHVGSDAYYSLAIKPLLNEPVFSEAAKFLYLTGKLLAQEPYASRSTVANAAGFMGVGSVSSKGSKNGNVLTLAYAHYTSQNRFVDLSTSFLAGIIKGMHGRNASIAKSASCKGIYNVRISY